MTARVTGGSDLWVVQQPACQGSSIRGGHLFGRREENPRYRNRRSPNMFRAYVHESDRAGAGDQTTDESNVPPAFVPRPARSARVPHRGACNAAREPSAAFGIRE